MDSDDCCSLGGRDETKGRHEGHHVDCGRSRKVVNIDNAGERSTVRDSLLFESRNRACSRQRASSLAQLHVWKRHCKGSTVFVITLKVWEGWSSRCLARRVVSECLMW